ncbi:sulfurtransferase [Nocardia sp. CNY236]|uniref:sulfurtransferase n=1 Tax=Nocardia sp. CNY236 TaxID=1169152 RepID=UPI00040E576B|nr:sulfurtransferase [Nocardia sp. CNY236]
MPVAPDPHFAFDSFADPHRLVTTQWLSANIGTHGLKIIEANDDTQLYDIGHVPGAIKLNCRRDLNNPITRDYIDGTRFTELMRAKGIERDDTVVIYGDRSNTQASHTAWIFTLFGHADVRLLDGGRAAWLSEERDTTFEPAHLGRSDYPAVHRDDAARAFRDDVLAHLGKPLIDVRTPAEYRGARTEPDDHHDAAAMRGGHVPGAANIPWTEALTSGGRFRSRGELDEVYRAVGERDEVMVYSHIGVRSSHTWFVLTHLLGRDNVRNYDGSWTEWGNTVRMPIVMGDEPGVVAADVVRGG